MLPTPLLWMAKVVLFRTWCCIWLIVFLTMTSSIAPLHLLVDGFRMKNKRCQMECINLRHRCLSPPSKALDSHMVGWKCPVSLDIPNYDWALQLISMTNKPYVYFQYWHTYNFYTCIRNHLRLLFSLFSMTRLGNTTKVVISRCHLLINLTTSVKLSYCWGNTKTP